MADKFALSGSLVDVTNAIGTATDGDRVFVPAGPAVSWTGQLVITKGIELIGATTITNAGTQNPTINNQTVITNDAVGAAQLIKVTLTAPKTFRLSGFTIQGGQGAGGGILIGTSGNTLVEDVRVDNCAFLLVKDRCITTGGWWYGVIYGNYFKPAGNGQCVYVQMPSHSGKLIGHGAWADYSWLGTDKFIFIESNTIVGAGVDPTNGALCDAELGGRMVIRYNDLTNSHIGWHGTEGNRGMRAAEVYNNVNRWTIGPDASNRSGVAFYHDNSWIGNKPSSGQNQHSRIDIFRENAALGSTGVFGFADGTCPLDKNDTEGNGTYVDGHSPHLYESGTVTGASTPATGGSATVTDNTKSWNTDQWKGYSIKQTKTTAGSYPKGSWIISNTDKTITFARYATTDRGPILAFAVNDTYEIHKLLKALDQVGAGKSDLLTGSSATGSVTNTVPGHVWAHNQLEPALSWNNVHTDGTAFGFITVEPSEVAGVDYYNLGKNHPSDGSIPSSYGGPVFNAALNGVDYTVPFTYPHPLRNTPQFTNAPLTTFILGQTNDFTFATNLTGTVSFTATGSLPTGVTLNSSTGVLHMGSGATPPTGDTTFTANATNGVDTVHQGFTLTIQAAVTKIINITPSSLAFGSVTINTTSVKSFDIKNTGNTVLTVTGITLPTGYTADWSSGTIAPTMTQTVNVTFAPVAGTTYNGTITVASDKTAGTNTLGVTGLGATRIIGLSGSLAFGNITVGQTATRNLTVTNSGTVVMTVTSVTYPEGFSGDFGSGTIAAGGSQVIHVTFAPTAAQAYSGTVTINCDKTSGTNTTSASGTGVNTATRIIQLTGSLDYGNVQTGTTVDKILTITNSGDSTLAVTNITCPTGFTPDITSATIASGASQDVVVTFAPITATSYSGTVTVTSDATGGANTTTASGTGVAPATRIIALSGDMAFGNVTVNTTVTRTLTITNTGSAVLTVSGITYPTGFTGAFNGTIDPGASQDVSVVFAPTAAQTYSGTITVASDKTSGTNTISASGTGVSTATRIINISGTLTFGNVQKKHSAKRTMTISNTGTGSLSVTNITCPTAFSTDITTATIAAGGSQAVVVTFAPDTAGDYGGTITVTSNKTSGVNTIPCAGTGTNKKQVPFILIVS